MPEVRADLTFESSDAFSTIDEVGSALDAAVTNFSTSMAEAFAAITPIEIEADTADASAAIDALAVDPQTLEVAADTVEAQTSLDSLEAEQPVVTVDVDDSQILSAADAAEALGQDLGGAGEQAESAAGSLGSAGTQAGIMAGSMRLAQGETSAVGSMFSQAAGKAGGFGTAAVGTAAALAAFFAVGEKSVAATERLALVFGKASEQVENIDVGGLTGELGELAVESGNSGAQLRQAVASLGQVGIASGQTKEQAAGVAQQFAALALRATAMNPQLGQAGDVVNGLQRGLATGGRFAARFGLSLTAAEIAAHALEMTGKSSTDQLTMYEKAAAGADLATQRLGDSMGKDFARGAEQTSVAMKRIQAEIVATIASFGRPLVEPIIGLLEAVVPVVTTLGTALGSVLQLFVPLLEGAAAVLGPFADGLSLIADGLAAIPSEVWLGIAAAVVIVGGAMAALSGQLTALALAFVTNPVTAWVAAIVGAVSVIGALGNAIGGTGESTAEAREEIRGMVNDLKQLGPAAAATRFLKEEVNALGLATQGIEHAGAFKDMLRDIRLLAAESPAVARNVVQGLLDMGAASTLSSREIDALHQAVETGTASFRNHEAQTRANAAADQALTDSTTVLQDRITALAQTIPATVDPAAQQFANFGQAVQQAFNGATPSVDQFIANLQTSVSGVQTWVSGIQALILAGLPGLATLVQSSGQQIGTALLNEINAATPETKAAWNAQLETGITAVDEQQAALTAAGTNAATMMVNGMQVVIPGAQGVGSQAGTNLGSSFQGTAVPSTGAAVNAAGQAVTGNATGLANPTYVAGAMVGAQFGDGIAGGMASRTGVVADAARRLVQAAEAAGRAEAQSASPSRLFMRLGEDLAKGLNIGLADNVVPSVPLPGVSNDGTVRIAAAPGTVAGGAGGGVTNVHVEGVTDPQAAAALVGRELAWQRRLARR